MMHLVGHSGKRCPSYKAEDCIDIFSKIWVDWKRHVNAALGYKRTGTLNALNGDDDHLIKREAKTYWNRLEMKGRREKVIHDVEVEHKAGRLQRTAAGIKAPIVPYPKTGKMDVILEFQDDEYPQLAEGEHAADSDDDHMAAALVDQKEADSDS